MARSQPRLVALGYGKFVRADRVFALVPFEGADRREGRRTRVHVEGIDEPLVASRSERALAADIERAMGEVAAPKRRRAVRTTAPGQERLI